MTPEQHRNQAELLCHSEDPELRRRADLHLRLADAIEARSTKALAGDKEWNEADHPRGQPGNAGQFGPGGGGSKPAKPARAPSRGAYAGQYVTTGSSPLANHALTVSRVLSNPINRGIHYRRMLGQLIREAPGFNGQSAIPGLKRKLVAALRETARVETERGRADEAARATRTADRLEATIPARPEPRTSPPSRAEVVANRAASRAGEANVLTPREREARPAPTPKPVAQPTSKLDKYAAGNRRTLANLYNQHVKKDPDEFTKDMLGPLHEGTRTITLEVSDYDPTTLVMRASFGFGLGAESGSMTRSIDFNTKTVSHDYLTIPPAKRNAGKAILASQIKTYEAMGMKKVKVHANIDVGAYAWAKYGFVPTENSWKDLRTNLQRRVEAVERGSTTLDKAQVASFKKLLENNDPKSLWKVVDHPAQVTVAGKPTTLAKVILTGHTAPHWYGNLDLGNKEVMDRFHSYVSKSA